MDSKIFREWVSDLIVRTGGYGGLVGLLKRYPLIYHVLRSWLGVILGNRPLVREIIAGPLKGSKMVLGPHDRNLYLLGEYEKPVFDLIRQLCAPGMHVLDVGANVGYFTLLFSTFVGPQGHVYALEPCPENVDKIREMIRVNRLTNVSLFPYGATDHAGVIDFQTDFTGSMGRIVEGITNDKVTVISIQALRIDDLIRENGIEKIDLVKIDVEGTEKQVLLGMPVLVSRHKPVIICEWHPMVAGSQYEFFFERLDYHSTCLDSFSLTDPFHVLAKPRKTYGDPREK